MSNQIRKLKKGKQESASASKLIGRPVASEGKNGDIQVRMSNKGPRLYAKLGNKWRTADLKDTELQNNVYIPKVWFWRGISPAAGSDLKIYLPDYINNATILGVSVGVSLGAYERTYFGFGDTLDDAIYDFLVHYNKQGNYIRLEVKSGASGTASKDTHVSVFFK
jgi:hypothetical protein